MYSKITYYAALILIESFYLIFISLSISWNNDFLMVGKLTT